MKNILNIFLPLFVLTFICLFSVFAQKQGPERIDSLLAELTKTTQDTNKVKLLNDFSYTYRLINPDEGIKYGEQALKLAEKLNWKKGIAYANQRLGANNMNKSDFLTALKYFQASLLQFHELKDKSGIAKTLHLFGVVYDYQSYFSKASEYYSASLNIYSELGDKDGIATMLMELGIVNDEQSDFSKALEYYFMSLKMYEEIGNKSKMGPIYSNIGSVYLRENNVAKALDYKLKAYKIFEQTGNKSGMAGTLNDIGLIYMDQHNGVKALYCFFKALQFNKETGNISWQVKNLVNIGAIYGDQKEYSKAKKCYVNAIALCKEIGDIYGMASNFNGIATIYFYAATDSNKTELNRIFAGNKTAILKQALIYNDSSIFAFKETGMLMYLFSAYNLSSQIYAELGDYKNALENFKNFIVVRDSVYNSDNNKKIAVLEAKRVEELNQKQLEIKDLQISKAKNQKWYFISGIFLLICFMIVLYNRYRFKSKANKIITKEKKRSDDLLLNILPAEVAEELKEKGHADARLFDEVTVLFTDFKGFTNYAEKMTPHELVKDIDECFKAFDQITGKYGIEKIKTIGDSYMCAGGLPVEKTTNPEDTVKAALEIRDFVLTGKQKKITEGKPFFEIRIGVHTGPVVAGIVGIKKFAYDIWGDTVNIASRMESSGEAGKVNISGSTYELVKDKFICTYRGKVEAKNKGMIDMYFVE